MEFGADDKPGSRSGYRSSRSLGLLQAECLRDSLGSILAVNESEVTPGRRQVCVPHPLHDLPRVGVSNHGAAEGVAEVVETEVLAQVCRPESGAVTLLQGLVADVLAACRTKDKIVVGGEVIALAESRQTFGDLLGHRHGSLGPALRRRRLTLGPVLADVDCAAGEIHVAPAQRQQLAHSQTGEGRRMEDRCVLIRLRRPDECQDLFGAQHVDLRRATNSRALNEIGGVAGQAIDLHRPLEDRAEADEVLLPRPVGAAVAADPEVDVLGRDRLDLAFAELADEDAGHVAVVAESGRLAVADVLAVGKPLVGGVSEGLAGLDQPRQGAVARLAQQLVQVRLGLAFREVAVGWRGLLGPGQPEPLLLLPAVRQPELGVPDNPTLPLALEDMAGDRVGRWLSHRSRILARFGTNSGPI